MKKILITGGTGFVGKYCLSLLEQQEVEIHVISSQEHKNSDKLIWHQIDLNNKHQVERLFENVKPTHLLHLAWDIKPKDYNGNKHFEWIEIGMNITKAFYGNGGKRMVVSGSCFEYDWTNVVCREDQLNPSPQYIYGFTKLILSQLIDKYCQQNNYSYAWGRIFFVYGHGGSEASLIPYVIDNLSNNRPVEIKEPHQIKDFIYIEDIANALVMLLESETQGAINISSGIPTKVEDIVRKIAHHFNKEELVTYNDRDIYADNLMVIGDNAKMLKELKFIPKYSIDQGIKKTIENYLKTI